MIQQKYNRAIQTGVYPHDTKFTQVIALFKKVQGMIRIIISRLTPYQFLEKYLKDYV